MKALIAMSGGVDSSVAAKLMIDKGYECVGCTMKLHSNTKDGVLKENSCCSTKDIEDAQSVCDKLSIPYSVSNFSSDFKEKIIDKFIASYEKGITPNPCIDCNRYMKFEKLYQRGKELGCDYIVTGHYVRIKEENGQYFLLKALDETKDQSYVLYSMTQEQLARTFFPLGELRKTEVREIAEANGFINAQKPDSQDICFVPDGDYAKLIEETTGRKPRSGNFISPDGKVLGKHRGIIHYTIGQRRGIGLSFPEPRYITDISKKHNTVTIGKQEDLFSSVLQASAFNWISGTEPEAPIRCSAKIRYLHKEQ
ncbi:MAG: tRNA 2-thiouridine(34) synthase MnmA, partial [Spirochaetales bacterium]|nr:tRNA 2-thiouridine(34) synthase MnmA [Candidatus Physcosoma equi]